MTKKDEAKKILNQPQKAVELLLDYVDEHFDDAEAFKLIGDCYHALGKEKRMIAHWSRAKQLGKKQGIKDDQLDHKLFTHQFKAKVMAQPDEVIDDKEALKRFNQGNELMQEGEYNEAIKAFEEAHQQAGKYYTPVLNKAMCYYFLKDLDRAIETAKEAAKINDKVALIHYDLGTFYNKTQQWDEAIKQFQVCVELDSEEADYWYNYGFALFFAKRYKESLEKLREARAISPAHPGALWTRALCWQELGNDKKTLQALATVLFVQPGWKKFAKEAFEKFKGTKDFEKLVAEG